MYIGAASADGLTDALNRCQPMTVHRTYDYKNVGDVEVLLTPKDISRRHNGLWHLGRSKFSLGLRHELIGRQLADGIYAGAAGFPDKCAVCLGEATEGVVWQTTGDVLPGGSGRYRAKDRRVVVAANLQRIWYSVPFCSAHAQHHGGVAMGTTMMNRGWIAFRNRDYGREFGELNGIEPRNLARRWWGLIAGLAALLLVLGIGGSIATLTDDGPAGDLVVAILLAGLGIALVAYLWIAFLVPWRARRQQPGENDRPRVVGSHRDRGDGYCAHCYQPWPCPSAR
jgi:hypothetical protein